MRRDSWVGERKDPSRTGSPPGVLLVDSVLVTGSVIEDRVLPKNAAFLHPTTLDAYILKRMYAPKLTCFPNSL